MTEQATIEQIIEQDKAIALFMGVKADVEFYIGNEEGSVFHPKHCGIDWPPRQKAECERWLTERGADVWVKKGGYQIKSQEWWPFYHQDWNRLMPVIEKIGNLRVKSTASYNPDLSFKIEIVNGYTQISGAPERIFYNSSLEGSMLNATFKAVVKFIQWYQSIQPPQVNE